MTQVTDLTLAGIIDDPNGVNSETVLAIATELQAFRGAADPGTPPDLQEWGHAYDDANENINTAIRWRDELARRGMTWFRFTKQPNRIYVDGWKVQPEHEAAFKVKPRQPVAHFHDTPIMSRSLLKRVRVAESEGMSHDDIIEMIEAEQGDQS